MLSIYGTEQVGISAEVALADLTGVEVDAKYRARSRDELVQHIRPALVKILPSIPKPISHIAAEQNPIDFLLEGDESLSVKSNMREPGKIAPQNIGQPTSATFWSRLPHFLPLGIDVGSLSYSESSILFKQLALSRTDDLLNEYWQNLFDCDYMVYVFDVVDRSNSLTTLPSAKVFGKAKAPKWDLSDFSFTQTLSSWKESCTIKYNGYSIGEFQIHNNRNCFKFRFNLKGLIQAGLL